MRRVTRRLLREQQGASTVIVALCMTVLLIVVALVVDIGATAMRKSQIQEAADAAALTIAQRCYEDWDANLSSSTDDLRGCPQNVLDAAKIDALEIANAHMGSAIDQLTLAVSPPLASNRVKVTATSTQDALFSFATGVEGTDLEVMAEAEWQLPAVAVPLAVNSCVLEPTTPEQLAFIGTGVYDGVGTLLDAILDVLETLNDLGNLPDFLDGVLACGTNIAAGGWLTSSGFDACQYNPNLLTTLSAVLNRLLPLDQGCVEMLQGALGKRIIVPVYDHSTFGLLGQIVGQEPVGYAEIVMTGYEFQTLLGLSNLTNPPIQQHLDTTTPGCRDRLSSLLDLTSSGAQGLTEAVVDSIDALLSQVSSGAASLVRPLLAAVKIVLGLVGGLADVLLPLLDAVVGMLTSLLGLCQGVQGYVTNPLMTEEEATAALTPYRLVA